MKNRAACGEPGSYCIPIITLSNYHIITLAYYRFFLT
jgi:hypothetical protein